jgi:hypothetical protein
MEFRIIEYLLNRNEIDVYSAILVVLFYIDLMASYSLYSKESVSSILQAVKNTITCLSVPFLFYLFAY